MSRGHRSGALAGSLVGLAAATLLWGCGSEPGAGAPPDPDTEAVALVRAERLVAASLSPDAPALAFDRLAVSGQVALLADRPAAAGPGRQPRAWVASVVAEGAWRLVFKAERGPCVIDCAGQRYWYFTVSPLGEPTLAGRHSLEAGVGAAHAEGRPRWGFPGEAERRLLETARATGR